MMMIMMMMIDDYDDVDADGADDKLSQNIFYSSS